MAVAVKFQVVLFCLTSVLPLLCTAHTQTSPGSKSTARTSQVDSSSEQLKFDIKNLRRVLKEEHTVQDSREENQGIENIPKNLGHETQNREKSLKNLDAPLTDPTIRKYFSDAIQEAQAEKQEIDDPQFPWKLAENEVTTKAHMMRTPVFSLFNRYRRKYKRLRRKYIRFLRGGNSRYKRKYFSFFKAFRRKYKKLLHKLRYPKMSRRKFKVSWKYYTLLNKFYILKRLVGKSKRKLKTLRKLLAKPNGKEAAKKLARKYVSKYRKLKRLYRLLSKKYSKLLQKLRFLRKHPRRVLPKTCITLLRFFHRMKKILKRYHKGGKFDIKRILNQLRKKLKVINLLHPRTTLCIRLILNTISPTATPRGTMNPPTKATVLPSQTPSTTPMQKSIMISPTKATVLPSKTPSTTLMQKSIIMPTRTSVLPSKNPSTTATPPKKTPAPDQKVLGILKVAVPPSTRTIPSPTRATLFPTRTTPPPAKTTPSPTKTTPPPARTIPSPTRTTAIRTRSSAPRAGTTPTPTPFIESALQQILNKILNS